MNPSQRAAVEATEGPIMVIAGAGSGKTRVLIYRIAHLMEAKNVDPFNILALTFTNKAAREMKERIAQIAGPSETKNLWMGTFHSIFARILRAEAGRLGYPAHFTIYDADDSKKAINNVIKELQLDKEIYKTKNVANRISSFKNALITPREYFNSPEIMEQDNAARMPQMGEIFNAYNEKCFRAGAMDFDDLLLNTFLMLKKFPEVLHKYQDRFRYIMVDEYQDTNHAQYLIVKALGNRFGNVCVVGDDAQSIYAFRGANIRNILNFQKDYDEIQVFKLEQNYRSTKNIVQAANSLILKNKEQLEKKVWTDNDTGAPITLHKNASDTEEGSYVARMIFEKVMNEKLAYRDIAVLYRTNAQSRAIEDSLRRKNIPYRIFGGLSFYQRKEVKDLLAYFRLAINSSDEEALRRIINFPKRGIGESTMEKITIKANKENASLYDICENLAFHHDLNLSRSIQSKIQDFITKIESFKVVIQQKESFEAATHIARGSGLMRELSEDKTPEGVNRYENMQELLNSVKEYNEEQREIENGDPSLTGFMQDVALISDLDNEDPAETNKVSLMTIHLAKGLEFPIVFIVGMEENLFPNMMSVNSRADLEEERRLFYVAMTRAEQEAFLTYTQMRYRFGKLIDCEPSRFLDEIDENFLKIDVPEFSPFMGEEELQKYRPKPSPKGDKGTRRPQTSVSGRNAQSTTPPRRNLKKVGSDTASGNYEKLTDVNPGDRVKHQRFGMGSIVDLEGNGANKKAVINFDNVGEKKLLLKFAKLEKV